MAQPKAPHRAGRFFKRAFGALVVIALMLGALASAYLYWRSHTCLAQLDGAIQTPSLETPAEIWRDTHGVPHLRAQSLEDLLFAQGYVTAQDRLWQMDRDRRLAQGQLSELFGERTLRLDIENRTLGLSQVAERAVVEVDANERRLLSAYARGVNAFISTQGHRLPIEFALFGYKPRPWREADSFAIALNMAKTLSTSWPDELMREHIRSKLNPELYADLFPDHSPLDRPVAETQQSGVGNRESGRQTRASGFGIRNSESEIGDLGFRKRSIEAIQANWTSGEDEIRTPGLMFSLVPSPQSLATSLGSNNWVVSGAHTASGKPLLANDPHLSHSVPSVWYMVHLKAPGFDVAGVSFPGLPGVIIGHNERIAWGVTNTGPDVQDLYIESFNLRDPPKYLHEGQWIDSEQREETIKVRHERDYHLTVKVTRHGPIISHDGDRDLALEWTALLPHALRFPFLKIDRAQNWQEFTDSLRDFAAPMQNFVYADVDGNIGYYAAGWVPIRKQGDGTVPSTGTSDDYDWRGMIPFESLPHAYNPSSGMIATANGRIVFDNYPYFITHRWAAPYRTARIYELLEAGNKFNVADMLRIQSDIYSMEDVWLRQQVFSAAAARPPESPDAQYALGLLRDWDGQARADSAATLALEVTRRALLERILKPKLGDDLSGYNWPMSTTFLENVLSHQWTRWLPPGDADFNATLIGSLEDAVRRIPQLLHARSRGAWAWGETIPLTFYHSLGRTTPLLGRFLNVGPYPQAGTGTTVKQTSSTLGPSMRMAVDFSNLDNSVQNITLGESGQVFSPYYRDQFDAWYSGQSFPMPFSDAAVEKATLHKLTLLPESHH